jgi:dTDP-4-amino-4,6-dideoxygalactose transaminase
MMWPCKGFDFSWEDWAFGLEASLSPPRRKTVRTRVERLWSEEGEAIACLTVRSAFDLFLRSAQWDQGDEIIFSAVTVPDIPILARRHGLRTVPLDIDPITTAWDVAALEERINPKTRAVVLTHLYGARLDIGPAIEVARRHGVLVIEDCAEAYAGPELPGHAEADLNLFSFGPMKTATAIGGGLVRVRDAKVREHMRSILERDPVQPTSEHLRRLISCGALKFSSTPRLFAIIIAVLEALGVEHQELIHRLTRSVSPEDLLTRIRQQPCAALLALLERRLYQGATPVSRRTELGRALFGALGPEVDLPTRDAEPHGYWLIPVLMSEPEALARELRSEGFYPMSGRLEIVTDSSIPTATSPGAERLVTESVYLSFDPDMPVSELERLGRIVTAAARKAENAREVTGP